MKNLFLVGLGECRNLKATTISKYHPHKNYEVDKTFTMAAIVVKEKYD